MYYSGGKKIEGNIKLKEIKEIEIIPRLIGGSKRKATTGHYIEEEQKK